MQELFLKNLTVILLLLISLYAFIKGFNAGFIQKVLSFTSIIFALIITKTLTPIATNSLKDITNIESTLTATLFNFITKNSLYDSLNIPTMSSSLNTSNIEMTIRDVLCTGIANSFIYLFCGIIIFIIMLIVLNLIIKFLHISEHVPNIGKMNRILGGVLGVLEVFLIICIILCTFSTFLAPYFASLL